MRINGSRLLPLPVRVISSWFSATSWIYTTHFYEIALSRVAGGRCHIASTPLMIGRSRRTAATRRRSQGREKWRLPAQRNHGRPSSHHVAAGWLFFTKKGLKFWRFGNISGNFNRIFTLLVQKRLFVSFDRSKYWHAIFLKERDVLSTVHRYIFWYFDCFVS